MLLNILKQFLSGISNPKTEWVRVRDNDISTAELIFASVVVILLPYWNSIPNLLYIAFVVLGISVCLKGFVFDNVKFFQWVSPSEVTSKKSWLLSCYCIAPLTFFDLFIKLFGVWTVMKPLYGVFLLYSLYLLFTGINNIKHDSQTTRPIFIKTIVFSALFVLVVLVALEGNRYFVSNAFYHYLF